MTISKNSNTYVKKKDSDVISTLIGNHSGLSADVTATTSKHPELVQYSCTDWDFMLSRAEVNGLVVYTDKGKVSVAKPDKSTTAVTEFRYGENIIDLDLDISATPQLAKVKAASWSIKDQKTDAAEASNTIAGPGDIANKKLADVLGVKTYNLQSAAPIPKADLTTWAKGRMLKSCYSKINGEVTSTGNEKLTPGAFIKLSGLSKRFNGDHFIAGVVHDLEDGTWTSTVMFGLDDAWFLDQKDVSESAAAGLIPAGNGMYTGTVKKIDADPDNEFRVQVSMPLLDPDDNGIWARLANMYATNGAGSFFYPEIGDEVLISFLNDDPRFPVVMGSLYSSKNKPFTDFEPDKKNPLKGIVSKSKIQLVFDDKDKILTITTPGKNVIVLDDKDKSVSIKDQNDNSIVMDKSGIMIKSGKDITLDAGGKVVIKGATGIEGTASGGDVKLKGMNIKAEGDIGFEGKGGATAKVEGGGQLTLKGAMVMIN
jgi:Rhs element Vgr protein